eukprot:12978198-Alexandrium_andersonii.AAC.1
MREDRTCGIVGHARAIHRAPSRNPVPIAAPVGCRRDDQRDRVGVGAEQGVGSEARCALS